MAHVRDDSVVNPSTSTREPCARADIPAETTSSAESTGAGFAAARAGATGAASADGLPQANVTTSAVATATHTYSITPRAREP
ncbi:hypothetical protein [Janibacter hoylei]|uniref:hypothetical protein n=1 Tax=Janibacter hoylei TaxID=364298 RepID=UPI0021A42CB6|nr:hypothetical protein [Janibacter hoylei]MCT1619648.1 hypothetical protein [Janibacter hoylei]MCT2294168.1 hypothetical protein [Janibacter hoylei]